LPQINPQSVAFIMGLAINDLVKSFVDNIFMPILTPILPSDKWQTAIFTVWSIELKYGLFLSSLIYFVILAVVVFILVKKLIPQKKKE
jgi:large conductance mechanosensitive channel